MSGIILALLAASSASFTNYIFRKNRENTACYLLFYYFIALIAVFVLYPNLLRLPFGEMAFLLGGCVGALNVLLMQMMTKALKAGPSSLTFAFQNASAVFPGLFLFLIFGSDYNFTISPFQLAGILFVLLGLFIGSTLKEGNFAFSTWIKYAVASFTIQILALSLIQSRNLFFADEFDIWFMPGQFSAALMFQFIIFVMGKGKIQKKSLVLGGIGGISNFITTGLLLLATKIALPFEKTMLFPCFSVTTIILCNLWANRIYKEKFNFLANTTCALGIFCGVYK